MRSRVIAYCLLALAVCAAGCRTGTYHAASLPAEFRAASTKAAPAINLSAMAFASPSSNLISAGDVLSVTVESGVEEDRPAPYVTRVEADGAIDLPIVGRVQVAGFDAVDASRAISSEAVRRGVYVHPAVNVTVEERATYAVTVLGAVESPGVHRIPIGGSSVVAAIAAAGGLTEDAGLDVDLFQQRGRPKLASGEQQGSGVQPVSYWQPPAGPGATPAAVTKRINLASKANPDLGDNKLGDGDVVVVLEKKKRFVYVSGLVNKPAEFELADDRDVHVLDAIAMAGGLSSTVANRVLVVRQRERAEPLVIQVSVSEAKRNGDANLILAAGDLVNVESTAATATVESLKSLLRLTLGVGQSITL